MDMYVSPLQISAVEPTCVFVLIFAIISSFPTLQNEAMANGAIRSGGVSGAWDNRWTYFVIEDFENIVPEQ